MGAALCIKLRAHIQRPLMAASPGGMAAMAALAASQRRRDRVIMECAVGAVAGARNNLAGDERRPSERWRKTGKRSIGGNRMGGERPLGANVAGARVTGATLARFAAPSVPGSVSPARLVASASARFRCALNMQAMSSVVGSLGCMFSGGMSARMLGRSFAGSPVAPVRVMLADQWRLLTTAAMASPWIRMASAALMWPVLLAMHSRVSLARISFFFSAARRRGCPVAAAAR